MPIVAFREQHVPHMPARFGYRPPTPLESTSNTPASIQNFSGSFGLMVSWDGLVALSAEDRLKAHRRPFREWRFTTDKDPAFAEILGIEPVERFKIVRL